LVDLENMLMIREQKLSKKESLLEEKEEKKIQAPKKTRQAVKKGTKKEKTKSIKDVKKKKSKETKKIGKDDVLSMIKKISDYVAKGDIAGAKNALSKVREFYNKLNKQDKESIKYDIISLETDIKLASLNL